MIIRDSLFTYFLAINAICLHKRFLLRDAIAKRINAGPSCTSVLTVRLTVGRLTTLRGL